MGIFEGEIPSDGPRLGPVEAEAAGPYMRGRDWVVEKGTSVN